MWELTSLTLEKNKSILELVFFQKNLFKEEISKIYTEIAFEEEFNKNYFDHCVDSDGTLLPLPNLQRLSTFQRVK